MRKAEERLRRFEKEIGDARRRQADEATVKLAEDAVLDAFVRIVRKRGRYDPSRPFKPWYLQILRNICLDLLREHARRATALRSLAHSAAPAEAQPLYPVADALDALARPDRMLLWLRVCEGLSLRQMRYRMARLGIGAVGGDATQDRGESL
jgi:RNA polymerase sigma factor (sigma-70 family)